MGEELKEGDGKNLQVHEILKGVCRKWDAVYNESTLIKIENPLKGNAHRRKDGQWRLYCASKPPGRKSLPTGGAVRGQLCPLKPCVFKHPH